MSVPIIYVVEGDEDVVRLVVGGIAICEFSHDTPKGIALLKMAAAPAPSSLAGGEVLVGAAERLVEIVEGISGAVQHGVWRDKVGLRLKDTPEWVAFYVASKRAALSPEAPARDDDLLPEGAISGTDDGQTVWLESHTGGAHELGVWGGLSLRFEEADGSHSIRNYVDAPLTPRHEAPAEGAFDTSPASPEAQRLGIQTKGDLAAWSKRMTEREGDHEIGVGFELCSAPAEGAGEWGWEREVCTGCSASLTFADIKARGCVSCCPDRRMVKVRDLVDAYEAPLRARSSAPEDYEGLLRDGLKERGLQVPTLPLPEAREGDQS